MRYFGIVVNPKHYIYEFMKKLLIISIITFCSILSIRCTQSENGKNINRENAPQELLLELFYGMNYDSLTNSYVDLVLDDIPGLKHYEYDKVWYYSGGEDYNISWPTRIGLYIDSIIPQKIWTNMQPILNKNFAENISYDFPFDTIYKNEIAEMVETPSDYAKKWENLINKFSETTKPTLPDSVYKEILPLRVCGVIHKIFEDKEWETYLIEFSVSFHGGCGCPSNADYISFNKSDGHQLTETEILAKYDKAALRAHLDKEFNKAKIRKGYDPLGGPSLYTDKLFGASGVAFIENGVLIYYQPYVAGCGAEGQYNIIIKDAMIK